MVYQKLLKRFNSETIYSVDTRNSGVYYCAIETGDGRTINSTSRVNITGNQKKIIHAKSIILPADYKIFSQNILMERAKKSYLISKNEEIDSQNDEKQ